MTLLDEVIEGASGDVPVAQLLRQLKVLASRTETPVLRDWVDHELGGYPVDIDVPAYRGPFSIRPLGHFVGPAGMEAKNVEIPPSTFPEELRSGQLFKHVVEDPIASVDQLATVEFTTLGWPSDFVRNYTRLVNAGRVKPVMADHLVLAEVRFYIPGTTYIGIVDAVRTKILELALELEQVAPLAGQRDAPPDQEAPAAAVINNHFHGPSNVAIGGDALQLIVELPAPGDDAALLRYLAAAGLSTRHLSDLIAVLDADREDVSAGVADDVVPMEGRWPRTRAWLAASATDTTTSALGGAIAAAAAGFLG